MYKTDLSKTSGMIEFILVTRHSVNLGRPTVEIMQVMLMCLFQHYVHLDVIRTIMNDLYGEV